MATNDPSNILYEGTTFLGKPTTIEQPGTLGLPEGGAPTGAPVAPGDGGAAGVAPGAAGGEAGAGAGAGAGEAGGPSLMQLVQQALGTAGKSTDFLGKLFGGGNTRGNVGGEGQLQQSDQSFSDQVRSMIEGGSAQYFNSPEGLAALGELGINTDLVPGAAGTTAGGLGSAGGLAQYFTTPQGLAALGELGINTSLPSGAAGGAAGGLSSGLGTGMAGAGAIAAILGLLGTMTGNQDLGKAAQVLGSTVGTAGTIGSAAAGTLGAPIGGVTGAALGPALSAGAGAAAGAAGVLAIPLAVVSLLDMFMGDGQMWAESAKSMAGDWPFFGAKLRNTLTGSGQNLGLLADALPYVESQQELGNLLGLYKQGMVNAGIGGYGEGSGPFAIPAVPGAGGSRHEGGQVADFGPQVNQLQLAVNRLQGMLPPEGGPAAGQLWNQLRTQRVVNPLDAPLYVPQAIPGLTVPVGDGTEFTYPGTPAGFYTKEQLGATGALTGPGGYLSYGEPGYDYAAAGLLPPGQAPAPSVSAYWQMLMDGSRPAAPVPAGTPGPVAPTAAGSGTLSLPIDEIIRQAAAEVGG